MSRNRVSALLPALFVGACVLATTATLAFGEEPRRVTVLTKKGDAVDAVLVGLSQTAVDVEVAGQAVAIPLDNVRYISFEGKLDETARPGAVASNPADAAIAAFREIESATRIGLLRDQYAAKLQETLPRVLAFLDTPSDSFRDAREAMLAAVDAYQVPLGRITKYDNPWSRAPYWWAKAAMFVAMADQLLKEDFPDHKEDAAELVLTPGQDRAGRLGYGDQTLPEPLGKSGLNVTRATNADVYRLDVQGPSRLEVTMTAAPCGSLLVVVGPDGKVVGKEGGYPTVTVKEKLKLPGTYKVWAACANWGEVHERVGTYTLRSTLTPIR